MANAQFKLAKRKLEKKVEKKVEKTCTIEVGESERKKKKANYMHLVGKVTKIKKKVTNKEAHWVASR